MDGKAILVTGSCGFIGSHMCELLVREGYRVIGFDRYNSENHWGWLEESECRSDMEIVLGDIRDYDSVSKMIKRSSAVIHMAALIGIPYSYVSPLAYLRTNVEGTYNVLESSRVYDLDQVVLISTSETYGSAQYIPIDEAHPSVGQSPYAASKIAADQLGISYHKSFDLPVRIARPFNTYGPRQSARGVIPSIISQVLLGKVDIQLGNTTPTRDFTYVADTCNAILAVYGSSELTGDVINIGSGAEISIGNLAKTIGELMEVDINIVDQDMRKRPEASEVSRLFCDNRKLLQHTQWSPHYDLKTGLIETIRWHRKLDLAKLEKQYNYNI